MSLKFVPFMQPTLAPEVPDGADWLHEIKYDGYRTQLVIEDGQARTFTRNSHDWTARYPRVVEAARCLPCQSAIIDGEMIVQDPQGRSDFHAFADALRHHRDRFILMAFDLIHLDGHSLRGLPLIERRAKLSNLIGLFDPRSPIHFSDAAANGTELFEAADAMGLEGIVSKRARSRYRPGPTQAWLKVKCFAEDAFTVIGIAPGEKGPPTALLARTDAGELEYAGSAMITLGGPQRERFWTQAKRLARKSPVLPMRKGKTEATWLEPEMRVRARFLKGEEKLRHATLTGVLMLLLAIMAI